VPRGQRDGSLRPYYQVSVPRKRRFSKEKLYLNILSIINVVLTCESNVLMSGSPVINSEFGTDYSAFVTIFF
jgi:hypothetical protein